MHGPASQAGRIGDRPHARVATIGEQSPGRVEDLGPVQRGITAPASLRSLLANVLAFLVRSLKWNALTHLRVSRRETEEGVLLEH